MDFLERLRTYLLRVSNANTEPSIRFEPDETWIQQRVVENLDALARLDPSEKGRKNREDLFAELIPKQKALAFIERLVDLFQEGYLREAPAAELERFAAAGLAERTGLSADLDSEGSRLLLEHAVREARWAEDTNRNSGATWKEVGRYSEEIRLIRRGANGLLLTPVGRVFLELAGRDTVAWLLAVETAMSLGIGDPWRLSTDGARLLLQATPLVLDWGDESDEPKLPAWPTVVRLERLGVLTTHEDQEAQFTEVAATSLGKDVLRACTEAQNPMTALAATLIQDEALAATRRGVGVVSGMVASATSADATARQARMVAHEIRNALVPTKTALSELFKDLAAQRPEAALARRSLIDSGIGDVFRFVDELVRLAALASTPPEPFDPLSAIADAIQELPGAPIRQLEPQSELPLLMGHRHRTVLALTNVLRNAVRAVEVRSPALIEVRAQVVGQRLRLAVDDNGPGVPPEQRHAIFLEGVSFFPGGSGLGLALVREVFESEMQGRVYCEESPLGGARFEINLPIAGTGKP